MRDERIICSHCYTSIASKSVQLFASEARSPRPLGLGSSPIKQGHSYTWYFFVHIERGGFVEMAKY